MYYNWPIRTATNTNHIRKLSISLSLIGSEGRTEVHWPETVRTERSGVRIKTIAGQHSLVGDEQATFGT